MILCVSTSATKCCVLRSGLQPLISYWTVHDGPLLSQYDLCLLSRLHDSYPWPATVCFLCVLSIASVLLSSASSCLSLAKCDICVVLSGWQAKLAYRRAHVIILDCSSHSTNDARAAMRVHSVNVSICTAGRATARQRT